MRLLILKCKDKLTVSLEKKEYEYYSIPLLNATSSFENGYAPLPTTLQITQQRSLGDGFANIIGLCRDNLKLYVPPSLAAYLYFSSKKSLYHCGNNPISPPMKPTIVSQKARVNHRHQRLMSF